MLGKFPGIEIWKIGSPSLYKGRWKIETYLFEYSSSYLSNETINEKLSYVDHFEILWELGA